MGTYLVDTLRGCAKRLAHGAGGLSAYHRLRNARRLTVLAFHRVLDGADPRRDEADPEWTVTVEQLAAWVGFAKEHYQIVSLDDVIEARRSRRRLPPRPLLITFDDGWADNEEHALPVLDAARVPAVIFVSGDAVERKTPFWREALRAAWRGGRIDEAALRPLWSAATGAVPVRGAAGLEVLIEKMSDLTGVNRQALLGPLESRLDDGLRHMLTASQLRRLRDRGVAVGAHGRTHEPLSACDDLDDELLQPRRRLGALLDAPITTLALPHSRFTPEVLRRAARAGYELVFTGEQQLSPVQPIPFAIGRIPIRGSDGLDERGRFRPDLAGLYLFRRQHLSAWT